MKRALYAIPLLAFAVAWLCSTAVTFAQQPVNLPKDDPYLYASFCFVTENFGAWLDARNTAVPASRTKLTQSAARYLHIDVAELPKVIATCQTFAANIRRINANAHNYVQSLSGQKKLPDSTALHAYESQRQAAIQAGIAQLKQQLSTASWNGLVAHINGDHRGSVQQVSFPAVPVLPPGSGH